MRFLHYDGLSAGALQPQLDRVRGHIERDEFSAVDLKKLTPTEYYRVKLSDAGRLIVQFIEHDGRRACLALEVLPNHEYEKSRFLRGAVVDEARVEVEPQLKVQTQPLKYVHPHRATFSLLDKPISFDDAQDEVLRRRPPLVLVGSAGSGKTALLLELLRQQTGRVAYVTESAWLAQHARRLYVSFNYEPHEQEADFLSLRQLLESVEVPAGRAVTFRDFLAFFERHRQKLRFTDAHRCFEEVRGVLTADAGGPLSAERYAELGVRLSLYDAEQRAALYEVFSRYEPFLTERGLYEPNLIAHRWLTKATPRYDFVAVDEVQDLTPVQLSLALALLKTKSAFVVAGDANQVVHPNFFSWSKVKTLFWQGLGAQRDQDVAILDVSYRNAREITVTANRLLALRHARFGSLDRESNTLLKPLEGEAGQVRGVKTGSSEIATLDQQTRRSTQVAVIVLREEDKAEARSSFKTPLVFSVLESKGLEYENVVLFRLVSSERKLFAQLAEGVGADRLAVEALDYARAKDKTDKSSEAYKFFVNALYVALTRAVKNVWLVEDEPTHPLLSLLQVPFEGQALATGALKAATMEEWQREASRLEAHGKLEQVEAIRSQVLKTTPTPWRPLDAAAMSELMDKALEPGGVSQKARVQLAEAVTLHPDWWVVQAQDLLGYRTREEHQQQEQAVLKRLLQAYEAKNFKSVLWDTEKYGIEFRSPHNLTPLMLAAMAGNVALVEALLSRGASRTARDHYGLQPFHWALRRAWRDRDFAKSDFGALWDLLAPASIDVRVEDRLIQLGREQGEFFIFHAMLERLWRSSLTRDGVLIGLASADFVAHLEPFPEVVVRGYRKRREYVSQMLAKNEVQSTSAYSRRLFKRMAHGRYVFNPELWLREEVGLGEDRWTKMSDLVGHPLRVKAMLLQTKWSPMQRAAMRGSPRRRL